MAVGSTTGIGGTSTGADAASAATQKTNQLGKDAFLQLLVTQLQHQDPTKPQADGEFLAQLAQFSSLEKLTQIADSIETLSAQVAKLTPAT